MTRRTVLSTIFMAMAVAACAGKPGEREFQASTAKQPMTADEIRAAFTGNSLTGTAKDGSIFHVYFADEATLRGIWRDGVVVDRDGGSWSVSEDGVYCSSWTKLRDGAEKCWRIYQGADGDLTWFLPDGTNDDDNSRLVPGNPAGL